MQKGKEEKYYTNYYMKRFTIVNLRMYIILKIKYRYKEKGSLQKLNQKTEIGALFLSSLSPMPPVALLISKRLIFQLIFLF